MRRAALLLSISLAAGCKQQDPEAARGDPAVQALRVTAFKPDYPAQAVLHERSGRGQVTYLGMSAKPERPARGDVVEVTHYFRVDRPATGDPDVFVHGEIPGSGERVLVADHAPALGKLPLRMWQQGEIWSDPHRIKIPTDVAAPAIDLWVGLYKGNARWTAEAARGGTDGKDRIHAARLPLSGPMPADGLPEVVIPRAQGPINPDGKLDEASWSAAPVLTFADSMGRDTPVKYATRLRLLYDDENLYVSFECDDVDITERFKNRDDPIYDHETAELFIMPKVAAPALGPYVELQASPTGVIFDASFEARRTGMNTSYDAGQTVGTTLDGTLNDPSPDKGWVSEWVVPWSGIRGAGGPPAPGDEWRMNAFRIEKYQEGGRQVGEFSAWSPPKVGDFHNVLRFGRMKFAGKPVGEGQGGSDGPGPQGGS
ncbi:MAG: carbohydrate-binding family 9-like protein [Myxococcales bacterium]|nr:carbohydrate-binding family 9-like protein [Myxococcales bacterium]